MLGGKFFDDLGNKPSAPVHHLDIYSYKNTVNKLVWSPLQGGENLQWTPIS